LKLYRNPTTKEIEKIVVKDWKPDSTFLHYTGHMFGIGSKMSSCMAMERISNLKQRKDKSGYIVLIESAQWLFDNGVEIPVSLNLILSRYWPGNLTVIIPVDNPMFNDVAINGKVAFRVPGDSLLRNVISTLGEPVISTSINLSGVQPAADLDEIKKRYSDWFDIGIVPSQTSLSEPSTIIEYCDIDEDGKPVLPHLKCIRESSIPFYQIKQSFTKPIITFVCMGNICRSPLAEYLFNQYSQEKNLPFIAKSAGLMDSGNAISLNSLLLLEEQNINANSHLSSRIDPEIIGGSWLVLTMEEYHRNVIRTHFPETSHKVFTLKEYIGETGDIEDPYGSDLENYRTTYNQIDAALKKLILMLEKQLIF
jgi:tRNA threonylcarbamoyl adenosine modification protein (Sua5/YciO/YrdC/YwlC family)